jgi:Tfp pilus assembly protein FimT
MKTTSILFIDPSVDNYESLLKGVIGNIKVVVLDRTVDGVAQITEVLSKYQEIENVHIVSHGVPGTLYLGNCELSLSTLELYADQLKKWFALSLQSPCAPSPHLLLYGCQVASGDAGSEFLTKLHQLTGASLSASSHFTGNAALGGDWNLEVNIGNISNQSLAFSAETMAAYPSVLAIVFQGSYDTSGSAENVTVVGNYAYVADQNSGLQIIDISNPINPTLTGTYDTPGIAFGVAVVDNYAYVADQAAGLQIIDISDPTNPTLISTYNTPDNAINVTVVGDYAYVADLNSNLNSDAPNTAAGLQIINISDPNNPTLQGRADTPGRAIDVSVVGNYAYIADEFEGLQIFDISNPSNPQLIGNYDYDDTGRALGVAVEGNYAYLADDNAGLHIIDISDPTSPTLVTNFDTRGPAYDVTVRGNYAYVADLDGFQVIDISDPSNPTLKENADTPARAEGIAVVNNYVYIADRNSGLQIFLDNTAPVLSDTDVILAAVQTDAGEPSGIVGTLVSSLVSVGGNVTDSDNGAVAGIAITGVDTTNGNWFYSTNNGENWVPLESVTDTNALLLAADANTRIYFQPNGSFTGTINNALTFRAWDTTTGSNGGTADTTINGNATAFSETSDTAAIIVNAANTAPVLSDTDVILAAVQTDAGEPSGIVGTLVSSLVSVGGNVTDSDNGAVAGIAITGVDTTNGNWFYSTNNGENWVPLESVTDTNALLLAADANTRIYFQPNGSFTGTINNALTFRAWDTTTGSNGGTADTTINGNTTAFSETSDTAAIIVNGTGSSTGIPAKLNQLPDNVFRFEGDGQSTLEVTLTGFSSRSVNELGVFVVDDEQGTIDGIAPGAEGYTEAAVARSKVVFSAIANAPNGFNTDLTRTLEFNSGENLRFLLVQDSTIDAVRFGNTPVTNVLVSNTLVSQVTDLGNGEFSLTWNNSSGNSATNLQDMAVKIRASDQPLPLGVSVQGDSQAELIDLRNATSPVNAEFTLHREAAFDNLIGFYQIADVNGGIDTNGDGTVDLLPGDAGYVQAAVRSRVSDIDLTVSNQSTATLTGVFEPGSLFAPFIIADGRPEEILDDNSSNDPAVYFAFLGANPGRVDHIRLLGNNTFGFEDLPNGGDRDYNDMIVKVDFNIA